MKLLLQGFVFLLIFTFHSQEPEKLFLSAPKRVKCRCFSERRDQPTGGRIAFSYAKKRQSFDGHLYYLAESDFFSSQDVFLRAEGDRIYATRGNSDEEILLDFGLKVGDTVKISPELFHVLDKKSFNQRLGEYVFAFRLVRLRPPIADGCTIVSIYATRSRGYVRVSYNCSGSPDYYCSIRQLL